MAALKYRIQMSFTSSPGACHPAPNRRNRRIQLRNSEGWRVPSFSLKLAPIALRISSGDIPDSAQASFVSIVSVLSNPSEPILKALRSWWREQAKETGSASATSLLLRNLWSFARDSTPGRRRQRYGDMEYDWENRVNTTSGTVDWRSRLLGLFHSPYQPTDPALFREMLASLPIDFSQFIFIDIGSGKGRTLLMASEYPFRKIVGVEIFAELDRAAQENIQAYKSPSQRCSQIQAICADARDFELPVEPLVLYLFNPLPEAALRQLVDRLGKSLARSPRAVWVVYHNPLLEPALAESPFLEKAGATAYCSLYRTKGPEL
jgi:SAM-dependent methyltransferase